MQFHTSEQIGPSRHLTSEGYLVCQNVPIARTGTQAYADGELPIAAGPNGIIEVTRPSEEVFSAATIASFEGKPITMAHPDKFVDADNWNDLACGITHSVRRGEGIWQDCLVADLMITKRSAIDAIMGGLREVSCGYDAHYDHDGPGKGTQRDIRGNHLALVDRGRCGPRCGIGDKEHITMAARTVWERLTGAFHTKDADAFARALDEARDKEEETEEEKKKRETSDALTKAVTAALAPISARLDTLDAKIKGRARDDKPDDQKDDETDEEYAARKKKEAEKTEDGKPSRAAWQDAMSRVELLSPGMSIPTFDSAASHDALCSCKRRALDAAYHTAHGKEAITPFLAGAPAKFDQMSGQALDAVFVGASELVRRANNGAATSRPRMHDAAPSGTPTPADLNRSNADFWARK